jgi:hypothetical protein
VMKRAFYRLSAAWAVGVMLSAPHMANAEDMNLDTGISSSTTPSLCLDSMQTVPIEDDLLPTEISVDGGCMVSETPISI